MRGAERTRASHARIRLSPVSLVYFTLAPDLSLKVRAFPRTNAKNVTTFLQSKGAFFYPQFWNKNGWYGMLGIIRIVCLKMPVEMRGPGPAFFLYETSLKKTSYFWYNEIRSNVSLCPKV